jgi:sugar O-acyltransferase (sialic acid O-acetyltransferase NeuD family)
MVIGDKIALIGSGGGARDILCQLIDAWKDMKIDYKGRVVFTEPDEIYQERTLMNCKVVPQSQLDFEKFHIILAIGNSKTRADALQTLPKNALFSTIIHPSCIISEWVEIGQGSVISAGSVITCNIQIGNHAQVNYGSTIGHDFQAGDFFSTGPGANINGNCTVGKRVYIGSNAALRQGVTIADDVTIGMGAVVLNSIQQSGIYAGIPAVKID